MNPLYASAGQGSRLKSTVRMGADPNQPVFSVEADQKRVQQSLTQEGFDLLRAKFAIANAMPQYRNTVNQFMTNFVIGKTRCQLGESKVNAALLMGSDRAIYELVDNLSRQTGRPVEILIMNRWDYEGEIAPMLFGDARTGPGRTSVCGRIDRANEQYNNGQPRPIIILRNLDGAHGIIKRVMENMLIHGMLYNQNTRKFTDVRNADIFITGLSNPQEISGRLSDKTLRQINTSAYLPVISHTP